MLQSSWPKLGVACILSALGRGGALCRRELFDLSLGSQDSRLRFGYAVGVEVPSSCLYS